MSETKYLNFEMINMDTEILKEELIKELQSENPDETYIEEIITYGAWGDSVDKFNKETTTIEKAFKLVHNESMTLPFLAERGYFSLIKLLLKDSNVDPNLQDWRGNTALIKASYRGHSQVVQALLEHPNIDPNLKDRHGYTALIWASRWGHSQVVKELLKHPLTDPNVKGEYDNITAIVWASNWGHSQVVQALLEHPKIDSNVKKESQDYRLTSELRNEMDAIIASHEERYGGEIKIDEVDVSIFKDLIEKGAYVNTLDQCFFTPLHWASEKGDIEFVKFLIERGAVLDICTLSGCATPLELSKNNEIIALLS